MIGVRLTDTTTKRLIVLILILVFSIPLLNSDTYASPDPSYNFAISMLARVK